MPGDPFAEMLDDPILKRITLGYLGEAMVIRLDKSQKAILDDWFWQAIEISLKGIMAESS